MTQISLNSARQVVAEALLSSPEVSAFVSDHFLGKSLKVFREIVPTNLPPAEDCPFVAFGPFTHSQNDKDIHRMDHAMPMGIFVEGNGSYEEVSENLFIVPSAVALDGLASLIEVVATGALLSAGYPIEQDPYLPDDVSWDQYFMSFYLYRVKTPRRINL